ncbi:MAG TPA: STAS domain-containing protein [Pseudonocardia sp.]|jgi:anti-anti-sigma factor|nr:STAS domain-containing protein [Pseudonocardia sp.]
MDSADARRATGSSRFALGTSLSATGVSLVTVGGDLDAVTAPALMDCVRGQLAAGAVALVIDLEAVDFLGSAGLAVLAESTRAVSEATPGSKLHLSGAAHRSVHRPLELVGLLPQFEVHPTSADALSSIEAARRG